ncbi:hypothetical protein [Loktanella sp. 5RATIMAR09]|uniref:hypothetical protein n=1 Tax=Loktanella sp. 5RATIMAR09 TaxID=1225655 RepID=UPI0025704039|nr:hypothetical protein [Loktanella sp. 5RATIMAR09]
MRHHRQTRSLLQKFTVGRVDYFDCLVDKPAQRGQMLPDFWISAQAFKNGCLFDRGYAAEEDIELLPHLPQVDRIIFDLLYELKKFNLCLNQRPLHIV